MTSTERTATTTTYLLRATARKSLLTTSVYLPHTIKTKADGIESSRKPAAVTSASQSAQPVVGTEHTARNRTSTTAFRRNNRPAQKAVLADLGDQIRRFVNVDVERSVASTNFASVRRPAPSTSVKKFENKSDLPKKDARPKGEAAFRDWLCKKQHEESKLATPIEIGCADDGTMLRQRQHQCDETFQKWLLSKTSSMKSINSPKIYSGGDIERADANAVTYLNWIEKHRHARQSTMHICCHSQPWMDVE
jgi:hypothetical protein